MDAATVLHKATSEDQLLATVCDALRALGWRYHHIRRSDKGQQMGHNGIPDVIAVRHNRLLFVELKAESGRLAPSQIQWHADLQKVAYFSDRSQPETWLVKPSTLDLFLDNLR